MPLLDVFLTTLWIVGFFLWIWCAVLVFTDIFRARDMSGWIKALWVLLVVVLPLLGVLIYLIARGRKMAERAMSDAQEQDEAFRAYVREVSGTSPANPSAELASLQSLKERGVLSEAEFEQQKAKVLS
jgi:Phospholipase_D-nuclease N-terminal/Short C-terminal domain